ncbi:MAG: tyrosine-type recombinase/integrase [Bacteroidota bacterium]
MENFKTAKLFDAGGDITKRWFVYYSFRSPETGKYRRFQHWVPAKILTCSGRRDKGHEMIKVLNKKLRQGYNPFAFLERKYTSISVAIDFVLSLKNTSCRKRTTHTYDSMVKKFKEWLEFKKLINLPVDDFNYTHAQEFMDYTKSVLGNGNRTYNNRVTAMKTIFKVLVKREYILVNPFENIERFPKQDASIIAFNVDELMIMQQYLPEWNYDLYVCACLIFYCFIRPQEIVRMRVSHINLRQRTIITLGATSKNKKQQVVQIPDALVPILAKLDLKFPGNFFVFAKNQKRGPKEYAPTRIAEAWREFADHYGIEKNIYSLKHTGVGMAIEAGINVRDLQLQLRHSSLEETQVYLDKFNVRPSAVLTTNFPDLARLARNNGPVHLPLPAHIYNPGQS